MTDLVELTIAQATEGLKKGEFSAVELAKAHIEEMEKAKHLNAYITETPDIALEMAAKSDERIKKGEAGELEGIPVGMKDLYCTNGVMTTAASHILEGFVPFYESTVSQKLWDAGAVLMGKTNLDEFAMGSGTITGYYGAAQNPWKRSNDDSVLVPGGSSGGSAAAVSAGLCMAATGTDTGGSIRQPASFCGVTGIKPTYGRCSRYGIIAFASSLDQAGPMARDVKDTALMLKIMAGFDNKDSTSAQIAVPDYLQALGGDLKGKVVGIPKEYRPNGINPDVIKMWDEGIKWLKDAGAEVVEISLPNTEYALTVYHVIASAECSSNLARYDGVRFGIRAEGNTLDEMYANTRMEGFGKEVRRRILVGTYILGSSRYEDYFLKAQKVRRLIVNDFNEAFKKVDFLLTPAAPSTAVREDEMRSQDPITVFLNDAFVCPASLAGLPAMVVPAALSSDGLPLGLQIIGKPFGEEMVFKAASIIEQAANFNRKPHRVEA